MRTSPLSDVIASRAPRWGEVNGMPAALGYAKEADLGAPALADGSCFARAGLKGPQAAAWLARQSVSVPPQPNHWEPLPAGGLIGRLATSEFFLEEEGAGTAATSVVTALGTGTQGVYPVLRQDAELVLSGRGALEVLAQTCNVDFGTIDPALKELVMTSMVGVSVLVIPQRLNGTLLFRIWCDPTLGPYLWRTLLEIVEEAGGGPIGLDGLDGFGIARP